jgi:hypothetical protein
MRDLAPLTPSTRLLVHWLWVVYRLLMLSFSFWGAPDHPAELRRRCVAMVIITPTRLHTHAHALLVFLLWTLHYSLTPSELILLVF